ncbi:MAG: hypothetical protein COA78_25410 [Blastopirellula sp.]|nr:MAG: hypothetical protein COA78_25410 [Blastopirellula sp.]
MKYADRRSQVVVQLSQSAQAKSISQGLAQAGLCVVDEVKAGMQALLITDLPLPEHQDFDAVIGIGIPNYQVDLCFAADVPTSEVVTASQLLTKLLSQQSRLSRMKKKKQHWKKAALTDPLTQLANRRAWERRGLKLVTNALRNNLVLTLAIIDVNHLKQVNREHGLPMGDWLLECLGQVLKSTFKQQLVARIGGDEFAVLGVDISIKEMSDLINMAQDQFTQMVQTKLPGFGKISFGISTQQCRSDGHATELLASLVHAADTQLRAAKNERD